MQLKYSLQPQKKIDITHIVVMALLKRAHRARSAFTGVCTIIRDERQVSSVLVEVHAAGF